MSYKFQAASIAFVIGTTKNATPSRFAGSARISSKLDGVGNSFAVSDHPLDVKCKSLLGHRAGII